MKRATHVDIGDLIAFVLFGFAMLSLLCALAAQIAGVAWRGNMAACLDHASLATCERLIGSDRAQ